MLNVQSCGSPGTSLKTTDIDGLLRNHRPLKWFALCIRLWNGVWKHLMTAHLLFDKLALWELTARDAWCLKHTAKKITALTLCIKSWAASASHVLLLLCLSSFGLGGYKTWSRIYPYIIDVLEVINKRKINKHRLWVPTQSYSWYILCLPAV